MSCNDKNCCSMIDDLLEQIQEGLGRVDYDRLDEYISEKINELREDIIDGDISATVDMEEVLNQVKEYLRNNRDLIDAYKVTYKSTNVGDKLDQLSRDIVPFTGQISKFRTYTKGEVLFNVPVYFTFSKQLKSLSVGVYVNDMNTETVELDVQCKRYEIPTMSVTTRVTVKAKSIDDEELILSTTALFLNKYYVGCSGAQNISNREVLSLSSYYAYENETDYSFIFHPIRSQYLWWAFPVDLHTDYDFFNNGFMDSNYVWTTGNLTNEYGYTSTYIFIRSGNPHTSSNIYTEVKAHEHK